MAKLDKKTRQRFLNMGSHMFYHNNEPYVSMRIESVSDLECILLCVYPDKIISVDSFLEFLFSSVTDTFKKEKNIKELKCSLMLDRKFLSLSECSAFLFDAIKSKPCDWELDDE